MKMRLLIVTTQDKFFLSHIRERAIFFQEHGYVVAVAAQKTSEELCNKIKELGFAFFDTRIERQSTNLFSQIRALIRLFNIQTSFKPDISYHLGAKAIFYGTFTAKLYNNSVGIINAPIGLGFVFASETLKAKLLRPIVLFLYKCFLNPSNSRVIIENQDDINFFIKKGYLNPKDAFCILGAGVDTDFFYPPPNTEKNKVCTVIMASRLIKEKGVFDFVESANRLYKNKVKVRMQLIGEPDYGNPSSITSKEYEEIKNNPSIECLGFQTDVSSSFKKAHVVCLPSYYREGLPRVLVEAASSGLAIITTDTIGCKETVRGNNGFLVRPHDVNKIVDVITYLATNPKELQEMGERSRKIALEYFDTRLICKRTLEIIKTLEHTLNK